MSLSRPKTLKEIQVARKALDEAEVTIRSDRKRELVRLKEKLPTLETRVSNVKSRIANLEDVLD